MGLSEAVLDEAWRLLVLRPSAAPALPPVAGRLLDDPADPVRLRAAYLLAVLGRQSARYADRLATLLDDAGKDPCLDGTVGDYARWALTRIGDPRALPGLADRARRVALRALSGVLRTRLLRQRRTTAATAH